jgi:hypothetical protein
MPQLQEEWSHEERLLAPQKVCRERNTAIFNSKRQLENE